ncbi:hypothetical protein K461DRAFT_296340 [Myriangium duriaei CBS 260.36]|uniref:Protein kinase domain-containing protein n=1 Tax=Myriangium duriaei CBS 260.36 TaxID=1168546 RepID=A0A9P4J026_9PEZI|nr:hypothetical protein K461DRAFT_296340 [Myriangium duriaei CBS 260.36]
MSLVDDLGLPGVVRYNRQEDMPFRRDEAWASFRGSYGMVYRATRRSKEGPPDEEDVYAIKQIQARSPKELMNVAREIKLLQQCRHPNIIALVESFTINTDGFRSTTCLVTKPWAPMYLEHLIFELDGSGGCQSSCSWFKAGELDPWPSILLQCLSGLKYLHTQKPHPIQSGTKI